MASQTGSRRRMSMQVVSTSVQKVTSAPKHNSAPPSAGGRRATYPAVSDRKLSLASNVHDGRRRSASEFNSSVSLIIWFMNTLVRLKKKAALE